MRLFPAKSRRADNVSQAVTSKVFRWGFQMCQLWTAFSDVFDKNDERCRLYKYRIGEARLRKRSSVDGYQVHLNVRIHRVLNCASIRTAYLKHGQLFVVSFVYQ